jgi:hypothetical protein
MMCLYEYFFNQNGEIPSFTPKTWIQYHYCPKFWNKVWSQRIGCGHATIKEFVKKYKRCE